MAKRLIPLLDRVLVKKVEPMTKSVGGIILPESAAPKINEGIVVAVGPGRRDMNGELMPMGVKEGDKVLLPEYGGSALKLEDTEYTIFRDDDIMGILEG